LTRRGSEIGYEYDESGDLVGVTDREGNRTGFGYSEVRAHYLDEIIDPLGRSGVRTEYDENGRLSRVLDVNGEAVELVYDLDNSTQTVRDVFGNPTTYVYDARGNVLTEVNAVGLVTERTYDGNDNLLTETVISDESGEDGYTTSYTYDSRGNLLSQTDPLGNVTRYSYNGLGLVLTKTDPLGNTTSYSYDSRGNLLTLTNAASQVTKFTYSSNGNLLLQKNALDNSTSFSYNIQGEIASITNAEGNTTRYEYDLNGNRTREINTVTTPNGIEEVVTHWTYDNENQLKTMTDPEGGITTYEYDANNNQIAIIDALGHRTEYRYNKRGQLVETIYPDETPNDLSDNPRTIGLYDRGGYRRASIDFLGRVTHFIYDAVGRLIETIHPDDSETQEQLLAAIAPGETLNTVDWIDVIYPDTPPAYLDDNHRVQTEYTQDGLLKVNIDERGNRIEYRYDPIGRLTKIIYADDTPDDLSNNSTVTLEYDASGRRVATTDALDRTTFYEYNELGRVTETIFPDGTNTQVSYDVLGRRESVTDQEGKVTEYFYDEVGRLTGVKDAMDFLTEYRYDELGRLIETEDANNHITKYEYDKVGRRTAVELPLGQRSSSIYDAVGNLQTYTDFSGEITQYDYDAQNRLIFKDYEDDADINYIYAADGPIETIIDGRGSTTFGYDALGRLLSRNDPDGDTTENGHTIEYEYDVAGNRTAVITPNGRVNYTFDEQNRLETVTDTNQGVTRYTYDAAGNLIRTDFPNNTVEIRRYDDLNRLIELKTIRQDPVTGEETILSGFEYILNNVGQRLSVTETDGRVVNYAYDDLYRLTEENINNGERIISYTYDNVGNRLTRNDSSEGITSYTYDDNDRLLTETLTKDGSIIYTVTYTYDDNGNLISRTQITDEVSETTTYIWNDDNRLVAVETPSGNSIAYEYDNEGIRVSATVDGETTNFLVDKNRPYAQVLEEFTSEQLQAFYVYGRDLISQIRNAEQGFYQVDGLGSTRALADENGNITDTYDYEAFGELIDSSGDSENDYLFAGEQFDDNLDDYYLRDRFYQQNTGRFIRRDTYEGRLQEPLSLHRYLYVHGNPVNLIDPTGLYSLTLQELELATVIVGTLATISVFGLVTQGELLEPLGGFGDGLPPVDPLLHTGHGQDDLLNGLLERLGGFGEGQDLDLPNTTADGWREDINSLISWVFSSIRDILVPNGQPIGQSGSSSKIREVQGDVDDALDLLAKIVWEGGGTFTDITPSAYEGILIRLPNGEIFGVRDHMNHSPNTNANVEVNAPISAPEIKKLNLTHKSRTKRHENKFWEDLIIEGTEDYVGLWEIIYEFHHTHPQANELEIQSMTLEAIREILKTGFMKIGMFKCVDDKK